MNRLPPVIPDNAPFSLEQRAWLNGFIAGLQNVWFSQTSTQPANSNELSLAANHSDVVTSFKASKTTVILILYGSQSGTTEGLAHQLSDNLKSHQGQIAFAPKVIGMENFADIDLAAETHVIALTSTWGDGEMPDNAVAFWEWLSSDAAPGLAHMQFGVLALGDKSYRRFCQAGKNLDSRFEDLGAKRLLPNCLCDVDFETTAQAWMQALQQTLISSMDENGGSSTTTQLRPATNHTTLEKSPESSNATSSAYDRKKPFPAALLENHPLNAKGSAKDTRHFSLSLHGSGLSYKVGDALGVLPRNDYDLVDRIILRLNCLGNECVTLDEGKEIPLRKALLEKLCLKRTTAELLLALLTGTSNSSERERLQSLISNSESDELRQFLATRDVLDVLDCFLHSHPQLQSVINSLGKLAPRLYSIASSPKENPGEVHLCVGIQRLNLDGRIRRGVASTYLAERVPLGLPVGVFIQPTSHFTLPSDPGIPMIMVGPGTGVAPFRAFLQERRQIGDPGKNWLFFGDQCRAHDFLYAEEFVAMHEQGLINKLSLAFSRDQERKFYVQDRMLEQAQELYSWLEKGAYFYVCGDAKRMAKDVDVALHQVIMGAGAHSDEQANAYVENLKKTKRYVRDVY